MRTFIFWLAFFSLAIFRTALATDVGDRDREEIINLNVGGQKYSYPLSTLEQGAFFRNLLVKKYTPKRDEKGRIFISYSQTAFRAVDHYLTTNTLLPGFDITTLTDAATYFDLQGMKNLIQQTYDYYLYETNFNSRDGMGWYAFCCEEKFYFNDFKDAKKHLIRLHNAEIRTYGTSINDESARWVIRYRISRYK